MSQQESHRWKSVELGADNVRLRDLVGRLADGVREAILSMDAATNCKFGVMPKLQALLAGAEREAQEVREATEGK